MDKPQFSQSQAEKRGLNIRPPESFSPLTHSCSDVMGVLNTVPLVNNKLLESVVLSIDFYQFASLVSISLYQAFDHIEVNACVQVVFDFGISSSSCPLV